MHRLELLVDVQDMAIEVPLPVERQDLPHQLDRHPFRRGLLSAPIEEAIVASPLIALLPAAHLPVRDPKDLGRLGPT